MVRPSRSVMRGAGLLAGPVLAMATFMLLPDAYLGADGVTVELGDAARVSAATGVWMAMWWITEAVDVSVTALLPVVVLPLAGARTIEQATAPYAHPLILLFLGGFILALSMQRWGLDKRIALLTLRVVGDRPRNIVGGLMLVAGVMSMWVSNTATVMMLLPVALSVIALLDRVDDGSGPASNGFAVALLLGVAHGASIGGVGTIIGTPPNLFVASYVRDRLGQEITFVQWMLLAMPMVAVFMVLAWLLLTRVLHRLPAEPLAGGRDLVEDEYEALGPASAGEWATFLVFTLTASAWITRPVLVELEILGARPLAGLTDTGIAVAAAVVLFVIPVHIREGTFVMDWSVTRDLPWGLLLLFGGGLSLAAAIDESGISAYLGHLAVSMGPLPTVLLVALIAAGALILSEVASNTATAAALVPVIAGVAAGLGVDAVHLVVAVALASSAGFMLPVATPPNAIVFGSGRITVAQMARVGLWLDVLSVILVTTTVILVVPRVLGGSS